MYYDTKHSFSHYRSEEGNIHVAWHFDDGKVLCMEYIPMNWPAGGVFTFDSIQEYEEAVSGADWMNEDTKIEN